MHPSNIIAHRLHTQQLTHHTFKTPAEVVAWFGAVQAQDYLGAKWALGQRLPGTVDADIESAFNEGSILRTHVMRPTWHFVAPADIRWLLMLTAPRVHQLNAYMYRQLELDENLLQQGNEALANALQGGKYLTREELGDALAEVGIEADGIRLGYIIHHAELDAVICSGPRRGKQFTYALLEERAPNARILTRDEALAELIRRFFTGHGPSTAKDFAWWSGLTMADAKIGLDMLKSELINDGEFWFAPANPTPKQDEPIAYLLPNYDEYTIAFKNHDALVSRLAGVNLMESFSSIFAHVIAVDGELVGAWRRTLKKDTVTVETNLLTVLTESEHQAIAAVVQLYGDFLGLKALLIS
ncbi:MAG: winged helix DNA-binding domain-containing protein [Anaerolineae bacterium]|nr:winged helix DNA-binding domain-containing protein [Anaerolineae bacterium]